MNNQIRLSPLPKGWVWARLDEVLEKFESGGRPKGGVRGIKSGIPSIGGEHLNTNGGFNLTKVKYIPISFFEKMSKGIIQRGDILIVKDGATTGKTSIVRDNFPFEKAAVNEHVFLLRPYKEVNNLYIFYYLFSQYGQKYVRKNFKGTAQGGINLTFFTNTFVPLPPLPEQHRIVAKIEELFTKLDAGVNALKKVKEQLKWYRQSLLKAAMEGKLTEKWREEYKDELEPASTLLEKIKEERKKKLGKKYKELSPVDTSELPELPEGWVWTTLENYCEKVTDGSHYTPKYVSDGYPFVTISDIGNDAIDFSNAKKISKEDFEKLKENCNPHKGDILFSKDGTVGKVVKVDFEKEFIVLSSLAIIRPFSFLYSDYVKYLLQSRWVLDQASKLKTGTALTRIILRNLKTVVIPIPSLPEQHQIVSEIERKLSIIDKIEKTVEDGLKQTERLRQSILKRAFEGKLVPQDPNDEPASVLLERIKAKKAKRESEKKNMNNVRKTKSRETQKRLIEYVK